MLCCGSRSRPIETMAECLGYDCRCRHVVPAFALMNISEDFKPLVLLHTPLENSGCTSVNQLIFDDGVCARSALNSLTFIFLWIGFAHTGALTTAMTIACWGTTASSTSASCASFISTSISEPPTAAPGMQLAAIGAAFSAEAEASGSVECSLAASGRQSATPGVTGWDEVVTP